MRFHRERSAVNGIFSYRTDRGKLRWGLEYRDPITGRWKMERGLPTQRRALQRRDELDQVEAGIREPDPDGMAYAKALEQYVKHQVAAGHREDSYVHLQGFWLEVFGSRSLASITSPEIETRLDDRAKAQGWRPRTRNLALNQLSGLFSYAYRRRWIEHHPTAFGRVERMPVGPPRERWLKPAELEAVIAKAPPWMADVLRFGAVTGMRLGEVCGLQRRDFHEEHGKAWVAAGQTKNGDPMLWPLMGWVLTLVRSRVKASTFPGSFLFPGPGRIGKEGQRLPGASARTALKRDLPDVVRAAGLTWGRFEKGGVTFHTLRHTMATNARLAGVPEATIQDLGNWHDRRMVAAYAKVPKESVQAGAKVLVAAFRPRNGTEKGTESRRRPRDKRTVRTGKRRE